MDILKKNPAFAIGAFYVLGVLVTAIHVSRFAIYDLELTKIRYIFAGAMCIYYLGLRIAVSAVLIDRTVIESMFRSAEDSIYNSLKDKSIFKIIHKIASFRLVGFFVKGYTPRSVANKFVQVVAIAAFFFVFATYLILLEPRNVSLTDPASSGLKETIFAFLGDPPFLVTALFLGQLAYLAYFYFKHAFQSTELLKNLWRFVFALVVIIDIGVYSIVIHPLVKPVFGGGVVVEISLIPANDESTKLIKTTTDLQLTSHGAARAFIVHTSKDAYYLTSKYSLNYRSPDFESIINHGKIFQLQKKLLSGYEIIGFR